jgi:hypothetical protein
MACDPNTLLEQARSILPLTEEQRALIGIQLLCTIAAAGGGGGGAGDFRITEQGDIRELETAGDLRIVE